MTENTNTNVSSNTVSPNTKSKKELKLEKKNQKYEKKLEKNRLQTIKKLEDKKAKLTVDLNRQQNPHKKSRIQDKIDEVDKKLKNLNDPSKATVKRPFGLVMKAWSKGLNKEAGRVTWHDKKSIVKDFVTVLLVCAFLAIIFFAIDMIIIAIR